jgi:hypothetical protein
MELEGKTVGAVEPWATTGGVRQATLPHTEELDELRRQLAEAERTADAARLAMPTLNIKIRKARTSLSDAIAAVRLAVVSVLADEAQSIIADIRRLDQESAHRRALLEAAIRHLDRTMARHRLGCRHDCPQYLDGIAKTKELGSRSASFSRRDLGAARRMQSQ